MRIRYYFDPDTGQPHIYNNDVREVENELVPKVREFIAQRSS